MDNKAIQRATRLFSIRYGAKASKEAKLRAIELEQAGFKEEADFWLSVEKCLKNKQDK